MIRYAAFLRAVNVGARTVKMEKLREVFNEMGFSDVSTFIASGNVLFSADSADSASHERRIESSLKQAFGFEIATFVRTVDEVRAISEYKPFDSGPDTYYVASLAEEPGEAVRNRVLALSSPEDELHFHGRELYWRSQKSFQDSPISGAILEKALGMAATLRNVNTVRRLAAKFSD